MNWIDESSEAKKPRRHLHPRAGLLVWVQLGDGAAMVAAEGILALVIITVESDVLSKAGEVTRMRRTVDTEVLFSPTVHRSGGPPGSVNLVPTRGCRRVHHLSVMLSIAE